MLTKYISSGILRFLIALLIGLAICVIYTGIEWLFWKKSTKKEEPLKKFRHFHRLSVFNASILIFCLFDFWLSLVVWAGYLIINFIVGKFSFNKDVRVIDQEFLKEKARLKKDKEKIAGRKLAMEKARLRLKSDGTKITNGKLIIEYVKTCFWSFAFFVLQSLFTQPRGSWNEYFSIALMWLSIAIIICFVARYLRRPNRSISSIYIVVWAIWLLFEIEWGILYFTEFR